MKTEELKDIDIYNITFKQWVELFGLEFGEEYHIGDVRARVCAETFNVYKGLKCKGDRVDFVKIVIDRIDSLPNPLVKNPNHHF